MKDTLISTQSDLDTFLDFVSSRVRFPFPVRTIERVNEARLAIIGSGLMLFTFEVETEDLNYKVFCVRLEGFGHSETRHFETLKARLKTLGFDCDEVTDDTWRFDTLPFSFTLIQ